MRHHLPYSEPSLPTVRTFGGRLPSLNVRSLADRLMRLVDRANQRDDLSDLTDEQLADIGVTRSEAQREAGKWFWE